MHFAEDHNFCNADEAITLHLVKTEKDYLQGGNEDLSFPPEFTEQFFGEEGRIYGYTGLKVEVFIHTVSFYTHYHLTFDSIAKDGGARNPKTNLRAKLKEIFGESLIDNRDAFIEKIKQSTDSFVQVIKEEGTAVDSWRAPTGRNPSDVSRMANGKLRQVVRLELTDPRVRKWYTCLTPLIHLFVEGGQPIESDDPRWEMYVTLEGEGPDIIVTGFCTVYRFFRYPDSTRLRIAQILVLPPYQGQGYGHRLLETINRIAVERDCYDITFEDPSDSLQELRDCMDVQRLLQFPPAVSALSLSIARLRRMAGGGGETATTSGLDPKSNTFTKGKKRNSDVDTDDNILVPPASVVEEARKAFKITKVQVKRCWESLLFLQLASSETGVVESFRELLIKRLHAGIFSNKDEAVGHGKHIIDTKNDYNINKTFMMMRTPQKETNGHDSKKIGDVLDASDEEKKLQALQELLEERENELQAVANKVSARCKKLGIAVKVKDLVNQA
ncbi:histone acetyltransferase type B catalytic subunit isoform X2 [Physcomitrium patens]|uniref:histone acetyltransferase n=1 Tax=Physcomitrium patens TaxID=3218 RepID=A0A7I4AVA3_PHYPA|nr:histone acetyltransferase type B catalytic subunit-like isoform X2 [Physcomitrium patens]|eukprot:XP_024396490.1 histone acetyltransferase type B catalytic subunit-like isoform X2 [Physcomitrella patens]